MMQKLFIYLLLVFLITACNTDNKTENKNPQTTVDQEAKVKTPENLFGAYISTEYLEALTKTKSTKKSQVFANLSNASIQVKGDAAVLSTYWNFHEGGAEHTIKMISNTTGDVMNDNKSIYKLEVIDDSRIKIYNAQEKFLLTKYSSNPKNLDGAEIINEKLVAGEYELGNQNITIKADGTINESIVFHIIALIRIIWMQEWIMIKYI